MSNNKIKTLNKKEISMQIKLEKNYVNNKHYLVPENRYLFNDNNQNYIKSAVLCLLEPDYAEGSYTIILTKRSQDLRNHAGQISFPGGKLEEIGLENYRQCAYREAFEEIGYKANNSTYIGKLNKFITGSGFIIQPIVALGNNKQSFRLNTNEVTKILHFPLNYLSLEHNYKKVFFDKDKKKFYYNIYWNKEKIWGATAVILIKLIKLLRS